LKLGIDASNIRTGGGLSHLKNILNHVDVEQYNIESIVIWSCKKTLNEIDEKPWLKKCSEPVMEDNYLLRALWQHKKLEIKLKEEKCDILFVPGGSFTTKYRPVVTMSQNLIPFELTELYRYGLSLSTIRFILLHFSQSFSFKNANGTIFLTEYAKDAVLKVTMPLKGETVVIPHGIDRRFFLYPRPQIGINKFSSEYPFQLLYVSTIEPYKHHRQVIDAVMKVRAEGYPILLKLVGGANSAELNRLIKKIMNVDPLGEFVQYLGFKTREELLLEYSKAGIFIFASSCETFGQILLEGMASGLPIVCSDHRPMPDILGDAGVYFDPENVDSIAAAILKLIKTPKLREKNSKMAFDKAQKYSWIRCTTETFSLLSQVLDEYKQNSITST
jgi:glycosyltransferase involved in cell wall biosynthesis